MNSCRLCQLQEGTIQIEDDFVNKVYECTHIQLNNSKTFPQKVCRLCQHNIEDFFVFLLKIRLVNERLQNLTVKEDADIERNSNVYCSKCEVKFEEPIAWKQHSCNAPKDLVTKTRKNINFKDKYECGLCPKKFNYNCELQVHYKEHGSSFICPYDNCKKKCTSINSLTRHKMKHDGIMPFLCVTCGKRFITKNSLKGHEKIHSEVKTFKCEECNVSYFSSSNLRSHEKKYHEGRRYYCSQCAKSFLTKCSLERHELVHTGIKEFKCQTCQSEFYTSKELIKHERYHQGVRLYECDKCFKRFFEKHHLTIHVRSHTGEKPYVCKVEGCGKSFTESQKLSRHTRARHPIVKF